MATESGDDREAEQAEGAEEAPSPAETLRGRSRDPKVFVLLRELSEVHLLLDNVSANPTTTVAESGPVPLPDELGRKWIEKVCEISWPPDGSTEEKAEDAALLIRAKDYLNRLSHPASGSTIAFTLLVTQGARDYKWRLKKGGVLSARQSPTRSSLAQAAYPDLVTKAAGFRRWMAVISVGLLLTLLLTCALSWYTAYGSAALSEYTAAQATLVVAENRVYEAESGEAGTEPDAGGTVRKGPGETASDKPFVAYCKRVSYTSANQSQLCGSLNRAQSGVARVQKRLFAWVCRSPLADCPEPVAASPQKAAAADPGSPGKTASAPAQKAAAANPGSPGKTASAPAQKAAAANPASPEKTAAAPAQKAAAATPASPSYEDLQNAPSRAAALANIMGSAVLPFLYGLLGAGAAIIRSLSRKIRSSLLSPRDLHLSFQQLALGAVVGACIGLFIAAPGTDDAGGSILGPVTLSASAISFVAGFGVEAVFQALEALIQRIFNIAPVATANRGDGVASN